MQAYYTERCVRPPLYSHSLVITKSLYPINRLKYNKHYIIIAIYINR